MDFDASLRAELAPIKHLRASLNMANPLLSRSNTLAEKPAGLTVDLSRELARRLDVELEFLQWSSPGQSVQALADGIADVGYLAVDAERGQQVHFTAPYVQIEACYMVREESALRDQSEVDHPRTEVLVLETSAYDLYLTRNLRHAAVVRLPTTQDVLWNLLNDTTGRKVAAGIRQALMADIRRSGGLRLLNGHFMAIIQAMVLPLRTGARARLAVDAFLEEMVSSGFVAESLRRHQIDGVTVIGAKRSRSSSDR
jgi:polar amino acid transport system substrate-binding protein